MKYKHTTILALSGLFLLVGGYFSWRYYDHNYPPFTRRFGDASVHIQIKTVADGSAIILPKTKLLVSLYDTTDRSRAYFKTTIATNEAGLADLYLRQNDIRSTSELFVISTNNGIGTYSGHPTAGAITLELSGYIGR